MAALVIIGDAPDDEGGACPTCGATQREQTLAKAFLKALREISYGEVKIHILAGKVRRIERTESELIE